MVAHGDGGQGKPGFKVGRNPLSSLLRCGKGKLTVYLGMNFFEFILLEVHSASGICRFMSLQLQKIHSLFFSKEISSPVFSTLSFQNSIGMDVRAHVIVPQVPKSLFLSYQSVFTDISLHCINSIDLSSYSLILSSVISILLMGPSGKYFYYIYCVSQLHNFHLVLLGNCTLK